MLEASSTIVLLEALDCRGVCVTVGDGEGGVLVGLRLGMSSLTPSVPYRSPLSARWLPLAPLPLS